MSQTIRDLFDIPDQIRKGDFVHKLTEGVANAKETAQTYVVTPGLAQAFDKALALVGSALLDGRSQAAYLHGSFGSGKSHFMAMLSLLLAGNEEAWRIPELHALREKHPYVGTRKLLELQFHMIGQESIEGAVFAGYLAYLREQHPDAQLPGLFADEQLFDNAERLRESLGDAKFFAPMNAGARADSGWGDVSDRWGAERFAAAVQSVDPEVRAALFTALVGSHFRGWEQSSRQYIDLDSGLAVIARHAAKLGYHAIVLFLDELILWLQARASDAKWLHQEIEKMVKLVEAKDMHREIPLVSFIARQRKISEMVGEDYAGVENMRLFESLQHWDGRYDKVELEDNNLPTIVERRILKAKDPDRKAIKSAFETMRKAAGSAWNTLLAREDQAAFEKLYPFSPALVDCLVALSNSLQRQRTAIKLLMELLVEHTGDLQVGEVVRVGDLFDLLASGQDSADGVMRHRFEAAKQMYRFQFLPLIQRANGTTSEAKCQRERPTHPARLGCAGCPERACRSDNRLVKTMIIASLVPEVPAVKELTASRLVALNHGSFKVPLPGTEGPIVAQKLRTWAAEIAQLSVGPESDPRVKLRLEGVELGPILARAQSADSKTARQRVLRDLVFEALGLEKIIEKHDRPHTVEWRGTARKGHVVFGNVRTMAADNLRATDDEDWRLIIDYPFDEGQFGPNDDLEALDRFVEAGSGSWTMVWLPSFLSDGMEKQLGELVILEHICESRETMLRYVSNLSPDDQTRAITDLENLKASKTARLMGVLQEAYGLASPKEGNLDSARLADKHVVLLKAGARPALRVPPNFGEAVETYIQDLLTVRWPRHPKLGEKLTRRRVEHLLEVFGQLVDADDKRLPADRALLEELRETLEQLELVRITETHVHLVEDRQLQELEKRRAQKAVEQPTVGELRQWLDEGGKRGLQVEAEDLIIRCYARATARTFIAWGKPYTVDAAKPIPDEVVLEKPELPSAADWAAAIRTAGVLGVSMPGRALHAENLRRFEAQVAAKLTETGKAPAQLPVELERWNQLLGVATDCDRARTARSAAALMASLAQGRIVDALAAYQPETSMAAVTRSLATAKANAAVLGERLVYGQLEAVAARPELEGGAELIERAAAVFRQDEANAALAPKLRELAEEAQRLLAPKAPPPGKVVTRQRVEARGKAAIRHELARLVAQLEHQLETSSEGVELSGELVIVEVKP